MTEPSASDRFRSASERPRRDRTGPPSSVPARLMVGAGAIAALSVIGAGLVRFPVAAEDMTADATGDRVDRSTVVDAARSKASSRAPSRASNTRKVKRPIRYVRLKPGQNAPPGARVIREAQPTPRVIIQRVAAPAPRAVAPRPRTVVARTRQSG